MRTEASEKEVKKMSVNTNEKSVADEDEQGGGPEGVIAEDSNFAAIMNDTAEPAIGAKCGVPETAGLSGGKDRTCLHAISLVVAKSFSLQS